MIGRQRQRNAHCQYVEQIHKIATANCCLYRSAFVRSLSYTKTSPFIWVFGFDSYSLTLSLTPAPSSFLYPSFCSAFGIFFACTHTHTHTPNSLIVCCSSTQRSFNEWIKVYSKMKRGMAISNRFCSFSVGFEAQKCNIAFEFHAHHARQPFLYFSGWYIFLSTCTSTPIIYHTEHLWYINRFLVRSSCNFICEWRQTCTPLIYHYRHRWTLSHEFSRVWRLFFSVRRCYFFVVVVVFFYIFFLLVDFFLLLLLRSYFGL